METKNINLLTDLFRAYYDARRNKRNTTSQLNFEMDLEKNLIDLYHELLNRTYKVGRSICFIVFKPVQREIFAAGFRDRVVHHLLYNYISPLLEKIFIDDSYSCRVGKGTGKGINRLEHHIRSCTKNYTEKSYVLKMDIQGFFMSIDREMLFGKTTHTLGKCIRREEERNKEKAAAIDRNLIHYLLEEVMLNDPTENCIVRGQKSDWNGLPASKSLFHSPKGVGLPIGNLTSQLFSNVLLNELDQYVKRNLCVKHYGRYVDDFYIVHRDKKMLLEYKNVIRLFLSNRLRMIMHPKKIYLQEVCKGVSFLGVTLKPHRRYINMRTKKNFIKCVSETEASLTKGNNVSKEEFRHIQCAVNSFLGCLKRCKTYKIRKTVFDRCPNLGGLYNLFGFKLNLC